MIRKILLGVVCFFLLFLSFRLKAEDVQLILILVALPIVAAIFAFLHVKEGFEKKQKQLEQNVNDAPDMFVLSSYEDVKEFYENVKERVLQSDISVPEKLKEHLDSITDKEASEEIEKLNQLANHLGCRVFFVKKGADVDTLCIGQIKDE